MNKKWVLKPKKSDDLTEQLLINRKIKNEDWASFLEPDFNRDLGDPFKMKGIREAVVRISKAIDQNEIIGIFGDYDADGIPGTALLDKTLKYLGLKTFAYIPSREQGYGLNREGINEFKTNKVTLLITVDLGTRNIDEIDYAQKLGMDVIVLDHHEVGKTLPDCIIVDPKQKNENYHFTEFAATGVVFKLIQALAKNYNKISIQYLKWSLDLVAISTICDIVPLISENRVLAKYGLIVLKKTKNIGLKELYKKIAIDPEKIDTYSVGFQIGPRLNAPGRIDNATESFFLLSTSDQNEAAKLAEKLDKINRERQQELDRVLVEARNKVCRKGLEKNKVILVEGENWPQGIVGLVAGKLMEEFARPVIVCEKTKEGLRGSARSIEAYNLIEALDSAKLYLVRYGGHKKAAGVSLEFKHLANLYDQLLKVAESKITDDDLIPKINIDAKLELKDINNRNYDKIKKFEPFGFGNPRPVFLLENIIATDIKTVGKENKHLKMKIGDIDAIGFDLGKYQNNIVNKRIDLVFTLDENTWNGNTKLQLKILDLKV